MSKERDAQSCLRDDEWDVFVSYASEDRQAVANPLANALKASGLRVWYDQFEIRPSDSLFASISEGLRSSRYGVVVLSPDFFAKGWTQRELRGLFSISTIEDRNCIIPVWYKMGASDIAKYSPLLSDIVAVRWEDGLETVTRQILSVVSPCSQDSVIPVPLIIAAEVRRALSKADYASLINRMMGNYGTADVSDALRSIALDIDQTVWIRIRALEILADIDAIHKVDWCELLQQPIRELLEGVIKIVTQSKVIFGEDQVKLLFSNPALPHKSTGNIGEMIHSFVDKGADYRSSVFLPVAESTSWEVKYNCVKAVIKLDDAESIPTLLPFSSMSYWQARRRIISYLVHRSNESRLTEDERVLALRIVNQIITDGKTDFRTRVMRQAQEALKVLQR